MVKPIAVFLGPSLPVAEARRVLDADYYPPARQGDLYRVMTSGVELVVLIDGVFHGTPSIWQRELVAALDEGIRVVGASSMGALRAAELQPFGMVGCGTVFEWYRDGVIEADDEVALTHATEEFAYKPLSEPLVNIRATLRGAEEGGILEPGMGQTLAAEVGRLHFSERSYEALWAASTFSKLSPEAQARVRSFVGEHPVNIKALDARRALEMARDGTQSLSVPEERRDCSVWDRERVLGAGVWCGGHTVTLGEVITHAQADPSLWSVALAPQAQEPHGALLNVLMERFFVLNYGNEFSVLPPAAALDAPWENGNVNSLSAHGLTTRVLEEELRARATFDWLVATEGGGDPGKVIETWAQRSGVSLLHGASTRLAEVILRLGPGYFGYDWDSDVAFARELQLSGLVPEVAKSLVP